MRDILEESARSMQGSEGLATSEQRSQWWGLRNRLDARLAALVSHLEADCLGPWRYARFSRQTVSICAGMLDPGMGVLNPGLISI